MKPFWSLVDKRGPDECWSWLGNKHVTSGRGLYWNGLRMVQAHRAAYEWANGGIPDGAHILHTCDNGQGGCVNPAHLYAGSHHDNMRDRRERGGPYVNGRGTGYRAKLTEDQVREIRRLVNVAGLPRALVARKFGISRMQAATIAAGKAWGHVA